MDEREVGGRQEGSEEGKMIGKQWKENITKGVSDGCRE